MSHECRLSHERQPYASVSHGRGIAAYRVSAGWRVWLFGLGCVTIIGGFWWWKRSSRARQVPVTARNGQDQVTGLGIAGPGAKMIVDENGIHMEIDSQQAAEAPSDDGSVNRVTGFGVAGPGATLVLSGPMASQMIQEVARRKMAKIKSSTDTKDSKSD